MPGTRQTNTFAEGLNSLLPAVSMLKTTPDADLNFIMELETMIVTKIREPQDQLAQFQAQQAGMGGMPPMDMQMAGPPPGPPGIPPGVGGLRQMPPQVSADELGRLLG